ncbi:hypothetical protein BASA81_007394 [Batrachochytrium salamandrivorans]|nr:hypothetical protein BASA81_007394 [Batrachochytrium salamandrivorans]
MLRSLLARNASLANTLLQAVEKKDVRGFGRFLRREQPPPPPKPSSKALKEEKPPVASGKKPERGNKDDPSPASMLGPSAAGLAMMMSAMYLLSKDRASGNEVDWQFFRSNLLMSGRVEKLVVVNKQRCKVYVKNHSTPVPSNESLGGGEFGQQSRRQGSAPAPSHAMYYFTVGSIDSFEQRLETVQRDLGIPPESYIPVQYATETNFGQLFVSFLPTLLIVGTSLFLMARMGGGLGGKSGGPMKDMFKIGKSPAKKMGKEESTVRFADVAGCEEAKQEIMEFVEFLKNPTKFTELGAKIPKGAMLYGPPGTGKTLLAKAVAGEASVPFFSISGSDFLEMFVGVGPSRVRDLFATARKDAPCIIFIDEIDAVARARNKSGFGGNDERENTLNQLLVELDGFNTKEGVVVMAATNRLDILDQAILRPGRFDRQIKVDLPDIQGRKAMFLVHLKNVRVANPDVTAVAQRMAALTPGFSGAQIANIVNEAAILAAREGGVGVTDQNFDKAVDRVIGGLEKSSNLMSPLEKKTVAYHEAGHAILGWFLEHADPLLKVTIIPRASGALGFAQYLPKEMSLQTQPQLEDKLCMALGGRAAEELTFGVVTTGAQNDLEKVTNIAKAMVTEFGMSKQLGQVNYSERNAQPGSTRPFSEETAMLIDHEVKRIVDGAYARAKDMLTTHGKEMKTLAEFLLLNETLSQNDLEKLIGARPWAADAAYSEFVSAAPTVKHDGDDEGEPTVAASQPAPA